MIIALTDEDIRIADQLGEALAKKFEGKKGLYGNNSPERHKVGKRGELAIEHWVRRLPTFYVPFFRDLDEYLKQPDVGVYSSTGKHTNLEVKTWRECFWAKYGRCIAVDKEKEDAGEEDAVFMKSHYVVWCTVEEVEDFTGNHMTRNVTLRGWSSLDEVKRANTVDTGTPERPAWNKQIAPSEIRPIDELRTALGF